MHKIHRLFLLNIAIVCCCIGIISSCKIGPSQAKNSSESSYALAEKLLSAKTTPEFKQISDKQLAPNIRLIIDEARICFGDSAILPSECLTTIVDSLALELSSKLYMVTEPQRIVQVLKKTIFEEGHLMCDRGSSDIKTLFPHIAFRRGHGSALGISMLLLAVGQKLEIPLYGVATPEYFFVRFDNGKEKINIDPLKKGHAYPDSWYKSRFSIADTSYFDLKNLSMREVVAYVKYAMAGIYKNHGLFAKAAQNYESVLSEMPEFADAYSSLGSTYDTLGQVDKSLAYFLKAKTLRGSRKNLSIDIGKLFIKRKNYAQAVIEYQSSLKDSPNSPELLYGLGLAYFRQNDFENAYKQLTAAVSVSDSYPAAYQLLAMVCEKTGENSKAAQYRALAVSHQ